MPATTRARIILFVALLVALGGVPAFPPFRPPPACAQKDDLAPAPPIRAIPPDRPEPEAVSSLTWFLIFLPPILVIVFIYTMMRRQRGILGNVDESMVISRRLLELSEESLALQKETVRLLTRISEAPKGS